MVPLKINSNQARWSCIVCDPQTWPIPPSVDELVLIPLPQAPSAHQVRRRLTTALQATQDVILCFSRTHPTTSRASAKYSVHAIERGPYPSAVPTMLGKGTGLPEPLMFLWFLPIGLDPNLVSRPRRMKGLKKKATDTNPTPPTRKLSLIPMLLRTPNKNLATARQRFQGPIICPQGHVKATNNISKTLSSADSHCRRWSGTVHNTLNEAVRTKQ